MQAVIMAGGKGTRLKPYTITFPKPLVPLGDYPILEIIIRQLSEQNFSKITIATGHCAGLIEAYFNNGKSWGVEISYSREDIPLNTAGALKLIEEFDEYFLVLNGDILTSLDFAGLYNLHIDKNAMATIAITRRESNIDFGVIKCDESKFLHEYIEKPTYDFEVSMGVYVLSRKCLDLIKEGEAIGMPELLLRIMKTGGRVFCSRQKCFWLDIGRAEDYEKAQDEFLREPSRFLSHFKEPLESLYNNQ